MADEELKKGTEPIEEDNDEEISSGEPTGTALQQRVAALSEGTWRLIQAVVGVLFGALVVILLFSGSAKDNDMWYTIYAAIVALIVPRLLEQHCDRSVQFGKLVMVGAIAAGLVGMLVYKWATGSLTGLFG